MHVLIIRKLRDVGLAWDGDCSGLSSCKAVGVMLRTRCVTSALWEVALADDSLLEVWMELPCALAHLWRSCEMRLAGERLVELQLLHVLLVLELPPHFVLFVMSGGMRLGNHGLSGVGRQLSLANVGLTHVVEMCYCSS